jgi:hypothetical protein
MLERSRDVRVVRLYVSLIDNAQVDIVKGTSSCEFQIETRKMLDIRYVGTTNEWYCILMKE